MRVDIYNTRREGREHVGSLTLEDGAVHKDPGVPRYIMGLVVGTPTGSVTVQSNPEQWLRYLPTEFRSGYVVAELVP